MGLLALAYRPRSRCLCGGHSVWHSGWARCWWGRGQTWR